jgi:phosphotransferase system enzyme I (PtsP)
MLESPALVYQIAHLAGRADFLSIGTNDLMQYFFAADRNNARMADRYDILSPPALHLLNDIRQAAEAAGVPLTICGEAAGRPLEAMALIGLGFTRLSMPASGVGPVKRMARALDALSLQGELERWMATPKSSIRSELSGFAEQQRVPL